MGRRRRLRPIAKIEQTLRPCFLTEGEALNGLFQATKRKARGYKRLSTMRTVLSLIAGKLDFPKINGNAA